MRGWVDSHKEEIKSFMQFLAQRIADGKTDSETALKLLGIYAESGIRKYIKSGSFTENAPSTVKQKGSSRPLIDTGTLRNSIRYEIVKKKKNKKNTLEYGKNDEKFASELAKHIRLKAGMKLEIIGKMDMTSIVGMHYFIQILLFYFKKLNYKELESMAQYVLARDEMGKNIDKTMIIKLYRTLQSVIGVFTHKPCKT